MATMRKGLVDAPLLFRKKDLEEGIIRLWEMPDERFTEDACGSRAVRFSAQLGFSMEDKNKGRDPGTCGKSSEGERRANPDGAELACDAFSPHPGIIREAPGNPASLRFSSGI